MEKMDIQKIIDAVSREMIKSALKKEQSVCSLSCLLRGTVGCRGDMKKLTCENLTEDGMCIFYSGIAYTVR